MVAATEAGARRLADIIKREPGSYDRMEPDVRAYFLGVAASVYTAMHEVIETARVNRETPRVVYVNAPLPPEADPGRQMVRWVADCYMVPWVNFSRPRPRGLDGRAAKATAAVLLLRDGPAGAAMSLRQAGRALGLTHGSVRYLFIMGSRSHNITLAANELGRWWRERRAV